MEEDHSWQVDALPCELCGRFFNSQMARDHHVKYICGKPAETQVCSECGKMLKSKGDLKRHIERFHSLTELNCYDCEMTFKCKWDLTRHVNNKHTERLKSEKCEQCGKEFYNRQELRKHRIHVHQNGVLKPFHCEVCAFKCSRLDNLNTHRKKHDKAKITKPMLISMVETDQHPFYTRDELPMLKQSLAD